MQSPTAAPVSEIRSAIYRGYAAASGSAQGRLFFAGQSNAVGSFWNAPFDRPLSVRTITGTINRHPQTKAPTRVPATGPAPISPQRLDRPVARRVQSAPTRR